MLRPLHLEVSTLYNLYSSLGCCTNCTCSWSFRRIYNIRPLCQCAPMRSAQSNGIAFQTVPQRNTSKPSKTVLVQCVTTNLIQQNSYLPREFDKLHPKNNFITYFNCHFRSAQCSEWAKRKGAIVDGARCSQCGNPGSHVQSAMNRHQTPLFGSYSKPSGSCSMVPHWWPKLLQYHPACKCIPGSLGT